MIKVGDKVKILSITRTTSGAVIPANALVGRITKIHGKIYHVFFKTHGVSGIYSERELELIGEEDV